MTLTRRTFLATTAATTGIVGITPWLLRAAAPAQPPAILRVGTRTIEVAGKPASVFGIVQPDGTHGLRARAGDRFRVRLDNATEEETLIHWHGLTPPWRQDGVPSLSQPALPAGQSYDYDFPLTLPGTYWMHSHHGLQEQRMMAAPLIVGDPTEAGADVQEVVVMLHDFTFRDPAEILAELQTGGQASAEAPASGGHGGHGTPAGRAPAAPVRPHLHDVEYDAFLANDRALDDPEVVRVEASGRVRLRIINAATSTNFWIDLERLEGRLIAVDGVPVEPVGGRLFEIAIAQRLDIRLDLPRGGGAWPVFAVREGDVKRSGFVLATKDGRVTHLATEAHRASAAVGLGLERRLKALRPLTPRPASRRHAVTISEAPGYVWRLNGAVHGEHTPLAAAAGERIEIAFVDKTTMAHPMHLHGHQFQVVEIDGQRLAGAVRDTVLVPSGGRVTIAFDADNPGKWALHCHHLYHMAGGMMTTLEYET